MSSETPKLINTSHLKQYALKLAGGKKERVSGEFFTEINAEIAKLVEKHVAAIPEEGKTIFGPSRRNVTWVEAASANPAPESSAESAPEPAAEEPASAEEPAKTEAAA